MKLFYAFGNLERRRQVHFLRWSVCSVVVSPIVSFVKIFDIKKEHFNIFCFVFRQMVKYTRCTSKKLQRKPDAIIQTTQFYYYL
jgi:hypothetical protein